MAGCSSTPDDAPEPTQLRTRVVILLLQEQLHQGRSQVFFVVRVVVEPLPVVPDVKLPTRWGPERVGGDVYHVGDHGGSAMTSLAQVEAFVTARDVAFIASIDDAGFPNVKALLRPRKVEGARVYYFSTNASSMRVAQYRANPKASLYFYKKGAVKYEGLMLVGTMEVLEDPSVKKEIWRTGDKLFYRKGVTDPDYCVLRFTAHEGRYYTDPKTERFSLA